MTYSQRNSAEGEAKGFSLPRTVGAFLDMLHKEIDDPNKNYEVEVQNCFLEAIRKYQKSNLYFLEKDSGCFETRQGKQIYYNADSPYIGKACRIISVQIFDDIQGMYFDLEQKPFDPSFFASHKEQGLPKMYMCFGQRLYLIPTPNKEYFIKIWVQGAPIPDPTQREETNIWIDEAYFLIKEATKALIYSNVFKDYQAGALAQNNEQEAYNQLIHESSHYKNYNQIQVNYF